MLGKIENNMESGITVKKWTDSIKGTHKHKSTKVDQGF